MPPPEQMPEYVMRDLCHKIEEDMIKCLHNVCALLSRNQDKYQIHAHATVHLISGMVAIANLLAGGRVPVPEVRQMIFEELQAAVARNDDIVQKTFEKYAKVVKR